MWSIWRSGLYSDLLVFSGDPGIPVLVSEFAVGRGSHVSVAKCFDRLAPEGTCWKPLKYIGIIGCYMLMMFYTTVGGWMLYYCFKSLRGDFVGADTEAVTGLFPI